jgi:hypothetical protein
MIPPLIPNSEPETPSERVALIVWHLAHGEGLNTLHIAQMTGLSLRGARELMYRVSRVIPIYQDDNDGMWQTCVFRETEREPQRVMVG